MPTDKTFSVGDTVFSSTGLTARWQVRADDGSGGFWIIIERLLKPEGSLRLYRQDDKALPMKLESKLRRLVKDYDKLGKRSIGL